MALDRLMTDDSGAPEAIEDRSGGGGPLDALPTIIGRLAPGAGVPNPSLRRSSSVGPRQTTEVDPCPRPRGSSICTRHDRPGSSPPSAIARGLAAAVTTRPGPVTSSARSRRREVQRRHRGRLSRLRLDHRRARLLRRRAVQAVPRRTPWRWPAAAWGIIGFLSLLLCVVLFLIAQRTTRLPSVSATVPAAPAGGPPPGWFPDPSGRYERRYWDGSGWTAQVATGETVTSDPA